MAIKTSTYGGWKLTGEHAEAFRKQIQASQPNPKAQASFRRGQKLVSEYIEKGYAVIRSKKG
jgi:hypothetical protein